MIPTITIKAPHQISGCFSDSTTLLTEGCIRLYKPDNKIIPPIIVNISPTKYQIGFISKLLLPIN